MEEFINEVLKRDEWGQIRVLNSEIRGKQPFGALIVKYRGDQIIGRGINYRQYLDQKVRGVRASGGWSAMDYTINLEAGGGYFMSRRVKFISCGKPSDLELKVNLFIGNVDVIDIQYQVHYTNGQLGLQGTHTAMIFYDDREEIRRMAKAQLNRHSKGGQE